MSLGSIFKRFVEKHIAAPAEAFGDDDIYHPTVNFVAERTGWHPAWIEEKLNQGLERHLAETGSRETLDDVTPRTIINYLKNIPDGETSAASMPRLKMEPSI